MKPAKYWLCRDITTTTKILSFSKSANIWSMMQNKNNEMEILRKIEISKNQKLLS